MKTLQLGLPLVMVLGWAVGAGCDDDRGATDIGAGGEVAGGKAGSAGAAGKAGGGGSETTPGGAGAGGAAAGAGGVAAGAGGVAGGAGGEGGIADGCPANIFAADGTACSGTPMYCSDGGTDPCQFGQSIVCQNGKWHHQEAFPMPCGGAGGQANGGAGGAGGAP